MQVPLTDHNYRVYVTDTVPGHIPEGKIRLTVFANGNPQGSKEVAIAEHTEGENRTCYAQCTYGDITALADGAKEFYIRAEYVPVSGVGKTENYEISEDQRAFDSTEPGIIAVHESVSLTYGGSEKTVDIAETASIKNANVSEFTEGYSNWNNVSKEDVVDIESGEGNSYIIIPENAGTTTIVFEVKGTVSKLETMSWYVIYDITVAPATVELALEDKTVEYSGNPVTADPATASIKYEGGKQDLTNVVYIAYSYYKDKDCTEELNDIPVNAGTYYVKVQTDPQRNYTAGEVVKSITINSTDSDDTKEPDNPTDSDEQKEPDNPTDPDNQKKQEETPKQEEVPTVPQTPNTPDVKPQVDLVQQEIDTVKKVQITGLKASKYKKSGIKLTWKNPKSSYELQGYQVYRSTKKNSGYKLVKTVKTNQFTIGKGLKSSTNYYFKVRGFRKINGKNVYTKDTSIIVNLNKKKAIPSLKLTGLKAVSSKRKVTITWNETQSMYGLSGYRIMQSTKKNSGYKTVGTVKGRKITVKKGLKKGKSYYFKIQGYVKSGKTKIYTKASVVKVKVK